MMMFNMFVTPVPVEQHHSAFHVEVTQSPYSSENVVHNAIVAQLSTLTTQMQTLADSVAAMHDIQRDADVAVASS
jgi:hypothetical protein